MKIPVFYHMKLLELKSIENWRRCNLVIESLISVIRSSGSCRTTPALALADDQLVSAKSHCAKWYLLEDSESMAAAGPSFLARVVCKEPIW